MLRFPINFQLKSLESVLPLNDDWTVCVRMVVEPHRIKFNTYLERKGKVPSEETLISGQLSLSGFKEKIWDHKFSKYWDISSNFMILECMLVYEIAFNKKISLIGEIIIVSKCNKCLSFWESKEYRNCVQPKSMLQLSNDFEQMIQPQEPSFSDVTLTCRNVSIPAHKMILSARSPFFAAMFKHPMKKNLENKVCLTDLDANVFQTMMLYIYSGKTSSLTVSLASDLLVAADKYQLQDLKEVCCDFLRNNITPENVVSILILGDRLDERLKSSGVDFIHKYYTDFSVFENIEEWKILRTNRPALAIDVLASIIKLKELKKKA